MLEHVDRALDATHAARRRGAGGDGRGLRERVEGTEQPRDGGGHPVLHSEACGVFVGREPRLVARAQQPLEEGGGQPEGAREARDGAARAELLAVAAEDELLRRRRERDERVRLEHLRASQSAGTLRRHSRVAIRKWQSHVASGNRMWQSQVAIG